MSLENDIGLIVECDICMTMAVRFGNVSKVQFAMELGNHGWDQKTYKDDDVLKTCCPKCAKQIPNESIGAK